MIYTATVWRGIRRPLDSALTFLFSHTKTHLKPLKHKYIHNFKL